MAIRPSPPLRIAPYSGLCASDLDYHRAAVQTDGFSAACGQSLLATDSGAAAQIGRPDDSAVSQ